MATNKITTPAPKKRRSPISRAEGEQRLVNAALELIRTQPFSAVGVRDIATLADVNHGFVHTWFGSKNDLLLAVIKQLSDQFTEVIVNAPAGTIALDPFSPDVQLFNRLAVWLNLEGVDTRSVLQGQPIISTLTQRFIDVEGLDPSIARAAAIQATAIGIGAASFAPVMDLTDAADLASVLSLWRHNVGLLAKYPPA